MKRNFGIIASALAICLLAAGCSASSNSYSSSSATASAAPQAAPSYELREYTAMEEEYGVAYDMAVEEPMPATGGGEATSLGGLGGQAVNADAENRKIIYTADVSLQTKEFEAGIAMLEEMTANYDGFIQSSNVQGKNLYDTSGRQSARYAYYTVRIPETGMRGFLGELENHFNVGSSSIYSDDITGSYYDIKARLESLRVQQERLLEMLGQAEDVEYLLEVQKELARVNYEIEALTSSLNRMDDSVAYSTVNLSIEEVVEYTAPQTIHTPFGEQMGNAFSGAWQSFVSFCQGFVLALISFSPFLIILVPIAVIVVLLVRRSRRKNKERLAAAPASAIQYYPQYQPQEAGVPQEPPEKAVEAEGPEQPDDEPRQ